MSNLDLRISQKYYENQEKFSEKLPERLHCKPSGKAPVKWSGYLIYENEYFQDDGSSSSKYWVWVTETGKFVIKMEERNHNFDHTFIKIREASNTDEIWSFASNPQEVMTLAIFLERVAIKLGDDSYFCKAIG